jgi:hypothetical protein
LPLTPDGNLTTAVKKQILLNNIFGVDIDAQAVEVTKLSLVLKCMEGETKSSLPRRCSLAKGCCRRWMISDRLYCNEGFFVILCIVI